MNIVPCRVSADLRAHQRREDLAPDEICDVCEKELFGEWEKENWLVCPCGNALCDECCMVIKEIPFSVHNAKFWSYLSWGIVRNEGFCSPSCMAKFLKRRIRELNHHDD